MVPADQILQPLIGREVIVNRALSGMLLRVENGRLVLDANGQQISVELSHVRSIQDADRQQTCTD